MLFSLITLAMYAIESLVSTIDDLDQGFGAGARNWFMVSEDSTSRHGGVKSKLQPTHTTIPTYICALLTQPADIGRST